LAGCIDLALDFFFFCLQIAQIAEPFLQIPKDRIVQTAGDFFSIAGNKGNRIAFVNEGNRIRYLFFLNIQFFCDDRM
jgi:hypothetical protein